MRRRFVAAILAMAGSLTLAHGQDDRLTLIVGTAAAARGQTAYGELQVPAGQRRRDVDSRGRHSRRETRQGRRLRRRQPRHRVRVDGRAHAPDLAHRSRACSAGRSSSRRSSTSRRSSR